MPAFEWNKRHCRFLVGELQCTTPIFTQGFYCAEHKAFFQGVPNSKLLSDLAHLMIAGLVVKDRKITALPWASWDSYINTWHELVSRGYERDVLTKYSADIIRQHDLFGHIYQDLGKLPKWRRFEKLAGALQTLIYEGAEIIFDEKVLGRRTGRERQVDVGIHFRQGLVDYFIAVECKHYNSAISIDRVESFATKLKDLGAKRGVMVTKRGFQRGAVEAAKADNIRLYSLKDEYSNWTKEIVDIVRKYPFPTAIDFDTPVRLKGPRTRGFDIREFAIYGGSDPKVKNALDLILFYLDSIPASIQLPFTLKLDFRTNSAPYYIRFPAHATAMPLNGISILLESIDVAVEQRELDAPPRLQSYLYKNEVTGEAESFDANDVDAILKGHLTEMGDSSEEKRLRPSGPRGTRLLGALTYTSLDDMAEKVEGW